MKTPTLGAWREKTYGNRGDVLALQPGLRVWLETARPPAWKGANDEKVRLFRLCLTPSIRIQAFCFIGQGSTRFHEPARQIRPPDYRSAHLGNRSLQLPLCLLPFGRSGKLSRSR